MTFSWMKWICLASSTVSFDFVKLFTIQYSIFFCILILLIDWLVEAPPGKWSSRVSTSVLWYHVTRWQTTVLLPTQLDCGHFLTKSLLTQQCLVNFSKWACLMQLRLGMFISTVSMIWGVKQRKQNQVQLLWFGLLRVKQRKQNQVQLFNDHFCKTRLAATPYHSCCRSAGIPRGSLPAPSLFPFCASSDTWPLAPQNPLCPLPALSSSPSLIGPDIDGSWMLANDCLWSPFMHPLLTLPVTTYRLD